MTPQINKDFIDKYSTLITDNICRSHNINPDDYESRAIIAWNIQNQNNQLIIVTPSMRNGKQYDGTTPKFGITYEDTLYMVKGQKDGNLTVLCEYVASNFIQALHVPCQTVMLGIYNHNIVNVIKDFAVEWELHVYSDITQSSENTDVSNKEYTYADVIHMLNSNLKLDEATKNNIITQFWIMYLLDAIIGNRDRHGGNWGYLYKGSNIKPAPLFDNGSSLFPNIISIQDTDITSKDFLKDRVFTFPASLLRNRKPDRSYKTNYYEVVKSKQFTSLEQARIEFLQNHNLRDIYNAISSVTKNVQGIVSDDIIQFWNYIVTLRFACIIDDYSYDDAYNEVRRL